LSWSELASRVKERFWAPVRSKSFRFLHLLKIGAIVPIAIITTASKIKSHKAPRLAGAAGVVAAAGVLAASEDALAGAAGVAAAAAGVLAVAAGVVAAAAGVSSLR